ncbi:uncharacterized protein LOC131242946 [Magnolia sinica]|uniref:uncharacterized protein LOC131242946 n=1 Tax=Magnolia sinica TaxID=86752 RepID=UPI00265969D7|nr:uncharacterized protein LOC131242946 [Magnolia sinica]XP_058097920.1 uncharacterized protein LOC131242946 [Magnolia sinica]XP_058097921.1 uncharacterized protein LOC131242946 [Magnolia sinica]
MKKKSQKSLPSIPPDLKTIIHKHSIFFDNLIELIPARFYLPVEDKEKPWFQGLSKVAKASFKKETRENIKKSRRSRLDPDNSSTTTLDLLKKSIQNEKSPTEKSDEIDVRIENPIPDDRSVTYEELRERLHRRIAELRGNRNTADKDDNKKKIDGKKKKRGDLPKRKQGLESEEMKASGLENGLAFGHVKIGEQDEQIRKKRKLSKAQELEKAKRLEEAKKDPEKGEVISKKHSWQAAVSRAAGVKVHDDPRILKQSIKKEKKRKEKNAEKWKERMESRDKARAEKQQTRSENILGRIREKKARRIAKREKKLMRPGFEGRKEGFINGP